MVAPAKPATPAGSGGKSTGAAAKGGSKLAPGEKININTANATDLARLPDVGAVKSKAIIDYRTAHGPFAKIDDIKKVAGIKEGTFAKIKDLIVVK
jgi:competence protein ComEA